jgi:hypothetical protein
MMPDDIPFLGPDHNLPPDSELERIAWIPLDDRPIALFPNALAILEVLPSYLRGDFGNM